MGSGAGSVVAASVAAAAGAEVLVVEKHDQLGGVTALSAGQIWIGPSTHAKAIGIEDSPEEVRRYIDFLSAGFGDEVNRSAYIDRGGEVLDALTELGLELQVIPGLADYYYPKAPGAKPEGRYLEVVPFDATALGEWEHRTVSTSGVSTGAIGGNRLSTVDLIECGSDHEKLARRTAERAERSERAMGAGLSASLIAIALEKGVEFLTGTAAVDLVADGRVDGVVTESADGRRTVRARRGVVLGMGGYDWNPELMESFEFVQGMHSVTLATVTAITSVSPPACAPPSRRPCPRESRRTWESMCRARRGAASRCTA